VAKLQATTGANVGVAEVQLVVDWAEIADCQVTFAVVVTIDPEDELPDQLLRAVQVLEIVCEAQ